MRIHVTSIEEPGPEDGQDLPVVHFQGVSRSLDDSFDNNANSDIRGKKIYTLAAHLRRVQSELTRRIWRQRYRSFNERGRSEMDNILGFPRYRALAQ